MEVKIECPCGTHFAFDVEPVNGRMPVRVNCPGCGTDQTELANEVISRRLSPPAPDPRPAARLTTSAAVPVTTTATNFCFRHLKNPAVETCRVCGKPICEACMRQYGYACSIYCRKRAEETGIDLPVYAKHEVVLAARITQVAAWILRVAVVLVMAGLGAWIWYAFFASQPRVIYSESLPHGDRARFYQLLAPDQVLSIKAGQMTLFDVAQQRPLWSAPLDVKFYRPPPRDPSVPDVEEQVSLYPEPRVMATTNDLWVLFPDRLVQYDRHGGNVKQQIAMSPPFSALAQNDAAFTVIYSDESGQQAMTRISLADGAVKTERVHFSSMPGAPPGRAPQKPVMTTPMNYGQLNQIIAATKSSLPGNAPQTGPKNPGDQFVADGADFVQVKLALLEHKTITHQAMKAANKKTEADGNLTAGQSLEAAQEMMNDTRRAQTGGVEEEDVSRYQVTLHQCPDNSVPEWTGEVVGPPSFFALKALNILAARNVIRVFDKNNKLLWTANLTYPIASHYSEDFAFGTYPPCVESDGILYVFDQGMLTSFDPATGAVNWRLTSVGISRLQPDGQGHLYVASTTASPDTIQFSQQVDFSSKAAPLILKVDTRSGRVLWRTEGLGDECYLSGKFVYAARAEESPMITPGEDPVYDFDLYRLSPADGHPLWRYSQSRQSVQIQVQENEILLHFKGALQIVKFLSL